MVKTRQKRHNWKARQSDNESVDKKATDSPKKTSMTDKIDLEIDETKYDSCNQLILETSKKASKPKTNKTNQNVNKTRVLSKKQKKKLEKVLQRKSRKINRAKLLSDLQEVRVGDKEIALMSSTSDVQTCGRKRF
ncbi:unnamed protein product, partial [Medioppia subpectinata]